MKMSRPLQPPSNDQVGRYDVSVDEKKNRRREVERISKSSNIVRLNKNKKTPSYLTFWDFCYAFYWR